MSSNVYGDSMTATNSPDERLHQPRYIRQKQLMMLLPFSAATLWRKVKAGTFVAPIRLSARVTAWNRASVEAWLDAQEGGAK